MPLDGDYFEHFEQEVSHYIMQHFIDLLSFDFLFWSLKNLRSGSYRSQIELTVVNWLGLTFWALIKICLVLRMAILNFQRSYLLWVLLFQLLCLAFFQLAPSSKLSSRVFLFVSFTQTWRPHRRFFVVAFKTKKIEMCPRVIYCAPYPS